MQKWLIFLCFSLSLQQIHAYSIDIQVKKSILEHTVVKYTVEDVQRLLKKAGAEDVFVNSKSTSNILLVLPEITQEKIASVPFRNYPTVPVVDRTYTWRGSYSGSKYTLMLEAHSHEGISAGLYGLLQEVLNFNFYHPRATQYPDLKVWPLSENLNYASQPRFNKMGFHLHTQHPTELTEALLDENFPGGEERIREYIDWLARNRQNYMEFCLLETINRDTWPAYAQKWVNYMKERGVIPGLDLSLHMKQQYAFKLYRNIPKSFKSKEKQILTRFNQLTQAGWKYWNVEFSETEFTSGNAEEKARLRRFVQDLMHKKDIHLTGREHVVKPEKMVGGGQTATVSKEDTLDKYRGTMIHTVMFYTLNDTLAPVYGNDNLLHMRDMLLEEMKHRETWYYPESAYWVTFDASIPMFLTPYLNGRLEDILYCNKIGVEGHLTFSSGWEWSYWLIDWSIANWSWKTTINGQEVVPYPEQYFDKVTSSKTAQQYFKNVVELQNQEIRVNNLMQYLTAMTVTDEMPFGQNLPFHPKPAYDYSAIRNKISQDVVDSLTQHAIPALKKFSQQYQTYRSNLSANDLKEPILQEIIESLDIVAKRAEHRAATLTYLLEFRRASISKDKKAKKAAKQYLEAAMQIRSEALKIVRSREAHYRYPVSELATKRPDHTSYQFGYLYPVHDLHFWEREEGQALKNKWKFWYKNIWNIWRIIGIVE